MKQIHQEQVKKLRKKRFPVSGSLDLTHRCNLRCRHCYVNLPASDKEAKKEELSFEEICRVVDEAADCGLLHLLLTGGEPLLRPDFKEIYLSIKKKGVSVALDTNGTLITSSLADFLAEFPPLYVEITLYGATPKTYESVTCVKGSYRRCMEGTRRLVEREIPLRLRAAVMTLNRDELNEMENLARDLGCFFRYGTYLNPRLNGAKEPLRLRISPKEAVAIDLEKPGRLRRYQEFCSYCPEGSKPRALYPCRAGKRSFHIDPTGKMTPCARSRKWHYDLRLGNFREAWLDFFPKKILSQKRGPLPCDGCNIRMFCVNCPAFSELEMGNSGGIVPYLCERAHLLAEALGLRPNTPTFRDPNELRRTQGA